MLIGSRGRGEERTFHLQRHMVAKGTRYVSVVTARAVTSPNEAITMPQSAGPAVRTVLKPTERRVMAAGTSRRSTISPTEACQAGSLRAPPHAIKKLKPRIIQGSTKPSATDAVSIADAMAIMHRPANITLRRLKLSARAPTKTDKTKAGSVDDAGTSATIRSEIETVAISQLMATVCINQPRLETCVASQIERKTGFLSGANVAGDPGSPSRSPPRSFLQHSPPSNGSHRLACAEVEACILTLIPLIALAGPEFETPQVRSLLQVRNFIHQGSIVW